MTPAAREAHLRMLATLPVRTHAKNFPAFSGVAWVRKTAIPKWKIAEAKRLDGRMARAKIARKLKLADSDLAKALGPAGHRGARGRGI